MNIPIALQAQVAMILLGSTCLLVSYWYVWREADGAETKVKWLSYAGGAFGVASLACKAAGLIE